ncbi:hypothetical protein AMECASPLE_034467 [Ameca splendens]|uniref:Uncharacterized protein n=1 Tax=Ameca splendens TaxID=208324 RepID=A0ABV0XKE6_9TELE
MFYFQILQTNSCFPFVRLLSLPTFLTPHSTFSHLSAGMKFKIVLTLFFVNFFIGCKKSFNTLDLCNKNPCRAGVGAVLCTGVVSNQDGANNGSLGASLSLCFCILCVFMFFEPQYCGLIQ